MTPNETRDIEAAARALYDACQTVKPNWDQLGDVTKSVWRERAAAQAAVQEPADAAKNNAHEAPTDVLRGSAPGQTSLF